MASQAPATNQTGGRTADVIEPVQETQPTPANPLQEKAAQFLAAHGGGDTTFTYEEEKAVLKRINLRVLPLILGAYFFQQLDKSSLSYVSIFGFQEDANLHGRQYSWLGSILYIAQLVWQPAAAFILVKLPNGKVIAAAIFLWGSSLAIMTACTNFGALLGLRFLLGTFEAMIAPSCLAVTTTWWRRSEQTLVTSSWNAMNGVTFIVGSLFTYGLGHIESDKLFKYQIIFLFCGLLTVTYSIVVLVFMPDSPMSAKYLTEREKVIAVERLRANQMGIQSGIWRWDHVWETFMDLKTWCWFVLVVAISIASGGISTFGNLIVKSFGYNSFQTILFNIPFGVIQIVAIMGSGWIATRTQRKGLVIAGIAVIPAIGTILMLTIPRQHKGVLLFGYYLVSTLAAITPLIYTWQAQNTAGDTKKKTTSAVVFIGMCTGNIIGPLLYSVDDAPVYRPGLISNLVMFILVAFMGALIPLYLKYLNVQHAKRREALGKSTQIVDESMMRNKDVQDSKAVELEEDPQRHQHRTIEEDHGLQDMTDLKNEDFIFVY
ncbi:major facilitator superfamily transporter [Colletotrichum higginsianum]|uniref:Major facilitator superfamily transporter n=2 Tax=Colletotrichum higginsianum TaxID=80884 RepID=H1V0U6_COLHI|nr:Major facilitator superfamily transporter [Colletotrichum higginsianum IMI 349063]OBR14458.1 Major facilitator superfamily transporter [Colletotrichum higginsianum IMI 349063]TID01802.1 putative transporter [Colletotrichum higginsianum]GJC94881.1 major facilitator superfamily transporter [Colletotrichum higginsianum]CCF33847.1 major facilitator superfamily transporter [Colletotrichum higginsianum]